MQRGSVRGISMVRRTSPAASDPAHQNAYPSRMRTVNINSMLERFSDHFKPHIVGRVNDSLVKLVKLEGPFVWHHHEEEDEMFLVIKGTLRMRLREEGSEREELVRPGEFIIIPRMTEHQPVADEEVHVMLFEPATTVNTGSAGGERTVTDLPLLR